MKQSINWKQ